MDREGWLFGRGKGEGGGEEGGWFGNRHGRLRGKETGRRVLGCLGDERFLNWIFI